MSQLSENNKEDLGLGRHCPDHLATPKSDSHWFASSLRRWVAESGRWNKVTTRCGTGRTSLMPVPGARGSSPTCQNQNHSQLPPTDPVSYLSISPEICKERGGNAKAGEAELALGGYGVLWGSRPDEMNRTVIHPTSSPQKRGPTVSQPLDVHR